MINLVLKFIVFILTIPPLLSQTHFIKKINLNIDQKGTIITTFYKDSRGYLWIGSNNAGLLRYDGYNIKKFLNNPNDSNSISNNNITTIAEDFNGNILIGTNNGLNKYIVKDKKFIHYYNQEKNDLSISDNSISHILVDSHKRIWIGTSNQGINLLNESNFTFKRFVHTPGNSKSISSNRVTSICEGGPDTLWIGLFEGGINQFIISKNEFSKSLPTEWGNKNKLELNVNKITNNHNGTYLIGTNLNGLYYFSPTNNTLTDVFENTTLHENLKFAHITSIASDNYNNKWIGTYRGGMIEIKPDGRKLIFDPEQEQNRISDWLVGGLYSADNNLFIGQWGPNLDVLYYTFPEFKHYLPFKNKIKTQGDFENIIKSIFVDSDEEIWIGTYKKGLVKYKKDSNEPDKNFSAKIESVNNNTITAIGEISPKIIIIGTMGGGLNLLNKKTNTFTYKQYSTSNNFSISDNNVTSICPLNDSLIWIGTANGLNLYNKKADSFTRFFHSDSIEKSISDDYINTIWCDTIHNETWIGTKGGLNCFTFKNTSFRKYFSTNSQLSDNNINCIIADRNHNIWIGTANGINCYLRNKNEFIRVAKSEGFHNKPIESLICDTLGIIWAGTNIGLVRIDPKNNQIRIYNKEDNIDNPHLQRCSFIKSNGNIIFGTQYGFFEFNPYNHILTTDRPRITITSIETIITDNFGNNIYNEIDVDSGNILGLDPTQNNLKINFTTFCYKQTSKCVYKYRIIGKDTTWINIGNTPFIFINHLNAGKYTLQIMGTNNENIWSKNIAEFSFRIYPVFWKSIYFYLIIVILLFITCSIFFIKKNKKKSIDMHVEQELLVPVEEINKYTEKLNKLMTDGKIYLKPELTLKDVAQELALSEKELSTLLNNKLKKNFADFVNEYRVEEAKKKLVDPSLKDMKILFIAFDSGFNSKAAFYSVFKKATGVTPSDYRKK